MMRYSMAPGHVYEREYEVGVKPGDEHSAMTADGKIKPEYVSRLNDLEREEWKRFDGIPFVDVGANI